MKIINVVGTRPNFIKIAPLMEQMLLEPSIDPILLHTGQHYDENMSQVFFDQLKIPKPHIYLGVGSGNNTNQINEIIKRVDPVLKREDPDAVLVVGDVNSTLACALAASYRGISVIHVEAGLRSFDNSMPEEKNRYTTDHLSELMFVTEKSGLENLAKEKVDPKKVHFVGNVMVDTLRKHSELAERNSRILETLKLKERQYAVVTLHRPSNVDNVNILKSILETIGKLAKELKVVFPLHPRTIEKIKEFNLEYTINTVTITAPLPYLDMLLLMSKARLVLTDSGGIQEETTALGVPCITMRENTERPITIEKGTNILGGNQGAGIWLAVENIMKTGGKKGAIPDFWDGKAANRIVKIIASWTPFC
jgi:UDP-N-acetylglucosamine 2-epimerase (non-hydrolysing)